MNQIRWNSIISFLILLLIRAISFKEILSNFDVSFINQILFNGFSSISSLILLTFSIQTKTIKQELNYRNYFTFSIWKKTQLSMKQLIKKLEIYALLKRLLFWDWLDILIKSSLVVFFSALTHLSVKPTFSKAL